MDFYFGCFSPTPFPSSFKCVKYILFFPPDARKSDIMRIKDYIVVFLKDFPCRIPSVKFWAITLLTVSAGIEIKMKDGHILTLKDCYIEMNDCANGNCYKTHEKDNIEE